MRVEGRFVSRRKAIQYLKDSGLKGCVFIQEGRWWKVVNPALSDHDSIPTAVKGTHWTRVEATQSLSDRKLTRKQPPKLTRNGKGKHLYHANRTQPIEMHFDTKGMHYKLA